MKDFHDYFANIKQEQIRKTTMVYLLIGIPGILFFTFSDGTIVGINGTVKWRIIGLVPMVISLIAYQQTRFTKIHIVYKTGQLLLISMILGVTIMMAALFHIVLVNSSTIDAVGLAGTIAGNLLAIFAVGTLKGLPPARVSSALLLPYIVLLIIFIAERSLSSIQWVFTANILAAIPLVLIIVNQRERADNARLSALYKLQEERENLERTVSERTRELEILLRELHHRVHNNLQIILSVINLYEDSYFSNTIIDKRFNMIRRAVQMISDAHRLSHNEHIIEKISMRVFFDEIFSDNYWKEELTIKREIDDVFFNVETAVVIGFICIHLIHQTTINDLITLTSNKHKAALTVIVDPIHSISSEDLNFALLLSNLINADFQTEAFEGKNITRIFIPVIS